MHFFFDSLFDTTFAFLKLNTKNIDAHVFECTLLGLPQPTWALTFSLLANMIKSLRDIFSFPFPTFQFTKKLDKLLGFIYFLYFRTPRPPPHLSGFCLSSWPAELCSLCSFKTSNALHVWLDKLYLRLEMFQWYLLLLLFTAVTPKLLSPLNSVGLTFKWNISPKPISVHVGRFLVKVNYFQWRVTELKL